MVELESVNRDDAGIRTNQDRSTEEETSLTSPTDLGDEDGYYSEWLCSMYFTCTAIQCSCSFLFCIFLRC